MIRRNFEAFESFKTYQTCAERHTDTKISFLHIYNKTPSSEKIKMVHSDIVGEYASKDFQNHLSERCVLNQLTIPYTPQQNVLEEHLNGTLMDLVRSMIHHSCIENKFRAEALTTAVYV